MRHRPILTLLALLLALLLASPARASLALTLCTPDQCVLASDSRTWDRTSDTAGADDARKVDIRHDFALLMTGHPAVWAAWQRTTPIPGETPRALARRVLAAVRGAAGQESAISILRAGTPIAAYVARVTFDATGYHVAQDAHPAALFAVALGWDDGGAVKAAQVRDLHRQVGRAPGADTLIRLARETLNLAAAQSPKVGGPSHIAVLDATGGRWLDGALDLHWDGTNLVIASGNLTVDNNGIRIAPADGVDYLTTTGYGYTVTDGVLGWGANDGTSNGRNLLAESRWSGTCASARCVSSVALGAFADTDGTVGTRGTSFLDLSAVANTNARAALTVALPGGATYGEFDLFAYLDYQPDGVTAAAAGSRTLPSNPCGFFVMGYQGAQVSVPFYAPDGGSCPTVP